MISLKAKPTLTAIELDHGESLSFQLGNGQTRHIKLIDTHAGIIETNLQDTRVEHHSGATILHFTCRIEIDGQSMDMERYISTQESFYQPYVINGLRIWFDGVARIFDHIVETHASCKPNKAARFALQDATLPICPESIHLWCPRDRNRIDIAECYNGSDCWMGPYNGASAHDGIDINHPRGTPLWAPIDFDRHELFNREGENANNNRWRGYRTWPDGTTWILTSCHMTRILIPEGEPIQCGTHYAEAAGVLSGDHDHSHFAFEVLERGQRILLDPWILFWQSFEQRRDRGGEILARMLPLSPGQTGQAIELSSAGCRTSRRGSMMTYHWTFGDGSVSREDNPQHVFAQPGIYPVTLTVDDGCERSSITQHITINGQALQKPCMVVTSPDILSFRPRPPQALDTYDTRPEHLPHQLHFLARSSRPTPRSKVIFLQSASDVDLPPILSAIVYYDGASDWVTLTQVEKKGILTIEVKVNAGSLAPGIHKARLDIDCPGAENGLQTCLIELNFTEEPPRDHAIVSESDPGCSKTPYFWVGGHFCRRPQTGDGGFYLTNGGRKRTDEWVRFIPDLMDGTYQVSFSHQTPFKPGTRFLVRVAHREGRAIHFAEPYKNREIGRFEFEEGNDGYVEILAENSEDQVLIDTIIFQRILGGRSNPKTVR